tara:strand:- start:8336 stop:8914 length:579 start_codon:yes stop_codon:yes gene_type:complete
MNKSLKCIIFLGLVVIILYFADVTTIMKEAFDMTECVESGKDSAPGCQYRSSHKKKWKECNKKQQKKYDEYVNEVVGAKCQQKMFNDSWRTTLSTDEDDETAKNDQLNHPATLNWAVAETEETLRDQREGDKLLKPIMSWTTDGRKLLKHGGTSILGKIMAPKQSQGSPSTFNDYYTYLMGEGEDEDGDEYY